MQATINRELLRFAVSTAMFCNACNTCLDVTSAVSFDLQDSTGQVVLSKVTCASCFDSIKPKLDKVLAKPGYTATVLDGRTMYGRGRGRGRRTA